MDVQDYEIIDYGDLVEQHNLEEIEFPEAKDPDYFYELPVEFGGTITKAMLDAQASQNHKGMMAFDIKKGASAASQ